jgi:Tol biopolymer transport system component
MKLTSGTALGAYIIRAHLGSGGMGEVYRAEDTRLGREVALKLLAPALSADAPGAARLEREARLLASLSHPGIAAIFGMEEALGRRFLVLELVPGDTLARRLARGPLPLPEALGAARDVADALDAAHACGVVHRDLKPANVMIRPDGRVSVLDFGLAKAMSGTEGADAHAPTLEVTLPGSVLGTPSYMSPEQARGRSVDARTDLWALGALLFECLSGSRAFAGETYAEIFAAILERSPAWERLPDSVPPRVRALLERALEKEPARRWASAAEMRGAIVAALDDLASGKPEARWLRSISRRVGRLFGGEPGHPPTESRRPAGEGRGRDLRLAQETFDEAIESAPAWSPEGTRIAFCREVGPVRKIFLKTPGRDDPRPITRGDHDDLQPTWLGEGKILFVRGRRPGRRLDPGDIFGAFDEGDIWLADLESGQEKRLVEHAFHPAVSSDFRSIAVDASWAGPRRIWRMDAQGRNPEQVTSDSSEAVSHLRPRWSPDGARIVFQTMERTQFNLRTIDLATRDMHWLTHDVILNVQPVWSPRGDAVYFSSYRGGGINIWRIPVDAGGRGAGTLEQVTSGAGQDIEAALSPDGTRLAFTTLRQNATLWRLPVDPLTGRAAGSPEKVVASSREDSRGCWSPDGGRIAFNSDRTGTMNVWMHEVETGASRRLTEGAGGDYQPTWSPDGRRLVFFSSREGRPGLWTVEIESGRLQKLTHDPAIEVNPFFSPDGRLLAYQSDRDGRLEVWLKGADGKDPRQLTRIGVMGHFLRWTRDGRFVIIRSPSDGGGLRRVSVDGGEPEAMPAVKGGSHISLSPDEARVMDVTEHRTLWVSPLSGGIPERVFEFQDPDIRIDYPVWSPDGRWVLFDRLRPQGGDIWVLDGIA